MPSTPAGQTVQTVLCYLFLHLGLIAEVDNDSGRSPGASRLAISVPYRTVDFILIHYKSREQAVTYN